MESLSAYARQFLERMEKPEVDEIDGIAPAVAIRQKNTTRNPRSTVATSTECYDFLRLLFARAGRTYCPGCGEQVQRDTVDHVAARMLARAGGVALVRAVPGGRRHAPGYRSALRDHLFELRKKGFNRLYQDGRTFEFSTPESLLDIDFSRPVFVLVDRLAIGPGPARAAGRYGGDLLPRGRRGHVRERRGRRARCASARSSRARQCGIEFAEPEPRLFSFNSPFGACPRCQGFGNTIDFDLDLVIPDKSSPRQGAVEPWTKPKYRSWLGNFRKTARARKVRLDVPVCDLSDAERERAGRLHPLAFSTTWKPRSTSCTCASS